MMWNGNGQSASRPLRALEKGHRHPTYTQRVLLLIDGETPFSHLLEILTQLVQGADCEFRPRWEMSFDHRHSLEVVVRSERQERLA